MTTEYSQLKAKFETALRKLGHAEREDVTRYIEARVERAVHNRTAHLTGNTREANREFARTGW